MKTKRSRLLTAALLATALQGAHALDLTPHAVALQAGIGKGGTDMAGVALQWNWDFERLRRAEVTAHTELMLNRWRYDAVGGGSSELTQVALVPTLRMQLARGRSPWFVEVGVGASWMDRLLVTPDKRFSTRWNFYDLAGVGYCFGDRRQQELGLRWAHVSNAGIRKPNPGQDFLQLRYVVHF